MFSERLREDILFYVYNVPRGGRRMISEKLRDELLDYLSLMGASLKQAQALIRNEAGETPSAIPDPMQTEMRWLQELLQKAGLDPGPIDGVWGPQTTKALSELHRRLLVIELHYHHEPVLRGGACA